MRKDVKLGFAIGGVLLAVLIVYVLVVPGGKDQRLTSASDQEASAQDGNANITLEPVVPPPVQPEDATATAPPAAPPVTFDPPPAGTDPFEQPKQVASSDSARSKDVDWSKLLNDSQMLMVTPARPEVPTPAMPIPAEESGAVEDSETAQAPDITKPGPTPIQPLPSNPGQTTDVPPVADSGAGETPASDEIVGPPPAPTSVVNDPSAQPTIHVVAAGESFSTISIKYYNNPNLYPAIMRANPTLDPQRLRPGMKVVVPPASDVKPAAPVAVNSDGAQVSSSRIEPQLDPATQYRVQPGDSLYTIAKKLYGRGERSGQIYEANKASIGEDMNAIKIGQVLTLPEPPANLSASR